MRHLSLIILSFLLTACSSLGGNNSVGTESSSVFLNTPKKVEYSGTLFSQYLKGYLAKNINPRSDTSRGLIDRSGIEANGRLPSKALYQSLGYRVRDAFVALPPELSTRSISSPEDILLGQLIQDTEVTWALLDTTKERLKSKGGLEKGRKDWEVSITRRNLLSEATGYWFQMRNQALYNQGITRLDNTTNAQFDEITQARQNYDVEDLRDKELALLGMRSDIALIFQFYSSEQARLFNRIDSRSLPNDNKRKVGLNKILSCTIDPELESKGNEFLKANYASQVEKILNNENKKSAIYELNKLARDISSKALEAHAEKLNAIEKEFIPRKQAAEQKRKLEVELLLEKHAQLIKLGQDVDPQQVEYLKSLPLDAERKPLVNSSESMAYYNAISVLSNWAADELVALNQKRLVSVLTDIDNIYVQYQEPIWQEVSQEVSIIRELLYEVYDYTLIDYLLGYERAVFANKALLNNCKTSSELSARNIEINHKAIDQLAGLIETTVGAGFPRDELKNKLKNIALLEKSITSNVLGDSFSQKNDAIQTKKKQREEQLASARAILSRNGYFLATGSEVLQFAHKEGYSVEVGAYAGVDDALKMIKRFKRSVPSLVYLSKKGQEDDEMVFKVLVGNERELDSIKNLQDRIEFGDIRSFEYIRNDI